MPSDCSNNGLFKSIDSPGILPTLPGIVDDVLFNARAQLFPDGSASLLVASRAVFREPGWEERGQHRRRTSALLAAISDPEADYIQAERDGRFLSDGETPPTDAENLRRSVRRARARVRTLARANDFTHFVTLTLDPARVDRYDVAEVTRRAVAWLSNRVQRNGLKYILVPELHYDGAIHFHGFFNDVLSLVDSGTITRSGGKPRKPRSAADRAAMLAAGGHPVFNLPAWSLGFTTALQLYGDYHSAVSYVCKYIGKQQSGALPERIGGRWYYSGGDLREPLTQYFNVDPDALRQMYGAVGYSFSVPDAGTDFVVYDLKSGGGDAFDTV